MNNIETKQRWTQSNSGRWRRKSTSRCPSKVTMTSDNPKFTEQSTVRELLSVLQVEDVYGMIESYNGKMGLKVLRQVCKEFERIISDYTCHISLCVDPTVVSTSSNTYALKSLVERFGSLQRISWRFQLLREYTMVCRIVSGATSSLPVNIHFKQQMLELVSRCLDSGNLDVDENPSAYSRNMSRFAQNFVDGMYAMGQVDMLHFTRDTVDSDENRLLLNVDGLSKVESLMDVRLQNVVIVSLEPIRTLEFLSKLNLEASEVSEISALGSCQLLVELSLKRTQVSDVTALQYCTLLSYLNLNNTAVSDVSALGNCMSLTELYLCWTRVADVSALGKCIHLVKLDLIRTPVSEINSLITCTSLVTIKLMNTQVSDVTGLLHCTSLAYLYLDNTPVSDIGPLGHCASLAELYLSNSLVSDITAIGNCKSIVKLNLSGSQVSDISALSHCSSLAHLDVSNLQVSDISAVGNCPCLFELNISYTGITDILPLRNCKSLCTLWLHGVRSSQAPELKSYLPNLRVHGAS